MQSSRGDFVVGLLGFVLCLQQAAVAQTPSAWKKPDGPPPAWLTADAPRWARLNETRKVLAKKVTYDFEGVPLREVVKDISRQLKVPIYINELELDNAGQSADQPVTARGKEVRLSEVKEQIFATLDLDYRIHESDIELTSSDDVEGEPDLRVYDLAFKSRESVDLDNLINVMAQTIDVDQWRDFGGTGDSTILAFGSALVVYAPEDTQRKITEFLSQLAKLPTATDWARAKIQPVPATGNTPNANTVRYVRNGEPLRAGRITLPPGREFTLVKLVEAKPDAVAKVASQSPRSESGKWAQPTSPAPAWLGIDESAERSELIAKLREPLSVNINGQPLNQALAVLFKKQSIAFWINAVELDNVGQSFEVPVTVALDNASLAEVLQRILKPLDLTYRIDGKRIEITSNDDAESQPYTHVYDMASMSEKPFDISLLANVIANTVDPETWRDYGGTGDSALIPSGSQLFISAPETTFQKIDSLLYQLSLMHPDNLPPAPAADAASYVEVMVEKIPGGSTIEIPKDGVYRLKY